MSLASLQQIGGLDTRTPSTREAIGVGAHALRPLKWTREYTWNRP